MSSRCIGIEVEVESMSLTQSRASTLLQNTGWEVTHDGSLRGGDYGFELRYNEPFPHNSTNRMLACLYPVIQHSTGSWRAAVHVHVDVRQLSWFRRGLVLGFAWLYDEALFERHSPERIESNFCVPLSHKSIAVREAIHHMLNDMTPMNYGKYSSINAQCMHQLGSIEFRHMQTPEFGTTVADVSNGLERIRKYADDVVYIVDKAAMLAAGCLQRSLSPLGRQRLLSNLYEAVETFERPLEADGHALSSVVDLLSGDQSVDSTKVDMTTIHRAGSTRPSRRNNVRERWRDDMPDEPEWYDDEPSEYGQTLSASEQRARRENEFQNFLDSIAEPGTPEPF